MTSPMKPIVLIIGEDGRLDVVRRALEQDGIQALVTKRPDAGRLAVDCNPDLIILGAAQRDPLRSFVEMSWSCDTRHVPIMLLPREDENDRLGAPWDDPVGRPDSAVLPSELMLRIRGLMRSLTGSARGHTLTFLDIVMDLRAQQVYRSGCRLHLGPLEFRLLEHFLRHPRQVFSRKELLQAGWPPNINVISRTVDIHIGRLRRALNAGEQPDYIRTVHSRGYSLDPVAQAPNGRGNFQEET